MANVCENISSLDELELFKSIRHVVFENVMNTKDWTNYVFMVAGFFGTILNVALAVSLVVALRKGLISFRRHYFVLNMTVADAVLSLFLLVETIMWRILYERKLKGMLDPNARSTVERDQWVTKRILDILKTSSYFIPAVNYLTITALQLFAVWQPIKYSIQMTKRACKVAISIVWLATLIIVCLCLVGHDHMAPVITKGIPSDARFAIYKVSRLVEMFLYGFFGVTASVVYLVTLKIKLCRIHPIRRPLRMDRFLKTLGLHVVFHIVFVSLILSIDVLKWSPSLAIIRHVICRDIPPCTLAISIAKVGPLASISRILLSIWLMRLILDPVIHYWMTPALGASAVNAYVTLVTSSFRLSRRRSSDRETFV